MALRIRDCLTTWWLPGAASARRTHQSTSALALQGAGSRGSHATQHQHSRSGAQHLGHVTGRTDWASEQGRSRAITVSLAWQYIIQLTSATTPTCPDDITCQRAQPCSPFFRPSVQVGEGWALGRRCCWCRCQTCSPTWCCSSVPRYKQRCSHHLHCESINSHRFQQITRQHNNSRLDCLLCARPLSPHRIAIYISPKGAGPLMAIVLGWHNGMQLNQQESWPHCDVKEV